MNTLNREFYSSCKPNTNKIIKLKSDIFTIKNFFVDFNLAKIFLSNLNKWECDSYDFTNKSGMETTLPSLVGMYLYDKSSLKANIKDFNLISVDISFLYYGQSKKFNKLQSSNGIFDLPHHDSIDTDKEQKTYVFLINLNDFPIYTNFWSYGGKSLMTDYSYNNFIDKVNKEYEINRENKKIPSDLSLDYNIKYEPNQALIYNSSLLHNANIEEKYTYSSPRITFRLLFESCPIFKNGINYF